jgi:dTDP-4-dehydrorhamnose 3,5-epimerase-like enzyme
MRPDDQLTILLTPRATVHVARFRPWLLRAERRAEVHYKVTERYDPRDAGGLRWNDPDVGIQWPISSPQLAARDAEYPVLRELTASQLPQTGAVE